MCTLFLGDKELGNAFYYSSLYDSVALVKELETETPYNVELC